MNTIRAVDERGIRPRGALNQQIAQRLRDAAELLEQ
jgi:hypothetical protein